MILGFDIGGTKCAVTAAKSSREEIEIKASEKIPTDLTVTPDEMIDRLIALADRISGGERVEAVGISCGGPLDSEKGIIMSPPNLPGWDDVRIVKKLEDYYNVPVKLQNDANACAVAEWKFGAGKGCKNMVFLTFGTGLGAGLIIDGKLYAGTNGNAGEVGHIRLDKSGPVGYEKSGSFEGFCSGGGIAQSGYALALKKAESGEYPLYFKPGMKKEDVTAKSIADAAEQGDETALEVYKICGEHLGRGLAVLIDLLNPERIVIGSIFTRAKDLMWKYASEEIRREALKGNADCCEVVCAKLGENLGNYAAIATAML
ncbi:MAG: ROK family protein [Clostridia bacterium]|nr:ROK family protein [Clostridia bacterium]